MTSDRCICLGDDCLAAREAIRKAEHIVGLVDESHFIVSILRCVGCGQHFLSLFCERVDWADGDDPQTRVVVPVSADEVQRLKTANVAADENAILEIVANERRFLYHDMPKGAAETLAWKTRTLFIPGHD
ncbi:MAG: hypothetical protein HY322_03925 [Betaproteobacteria bacterium]|nr:hypothetical protein [Betaproteobacteria bacterium]